MSFPKQKYCEVVAMFKSMEDLEDAADELNWHGINQSDLSVVDDQKFVQHFNKKFAQMKSALSWKDLPRTDYSAEENMGAAQGSLIGGITYVLTLLAACIMIARNYPTWSVIIGTIFAAVIGISCGIWLSRLVLQKHVNSLHHQLSMGGLLLWVHISDQAKSAQICSILKKHAAFEVHYYCIVSAI